MEPLDQLTIDTPEQIALEFGVAGIGSRLLAIALDTLIQLALYFLLTLGFVSLAKLAPKGGGGTPMSDKGAMWAAAGVSLVLYCIYWGYFAAFEALWHGQTPGKRALKIRVIKDSGRPMDAIEAIGRNIVRAVDSLPFLYGVGLVTMAISRKNQRLGDMLAGTIVVHERVQESVRPDFESLDAGPSPGVALSPGLNQLDERDLQLLEAFLHRRSQLDGMARMRAADAIVAHLKAKAELMPGPEEGPETFLERTARSLRDHAGFTGQRGSGKWG